MEAYIAAHWNEYLTAFSPEKKDIYYREEYVRLYETAEDIAACFVCKDGENILLMPFLRRKVGQFFDFETPYGYGGPITNTDDDGWVYQALEAMHSCFCRQNYLCGFVRFHPLLGNEKLFGRRFEVCCDRQTVSIPLRGTTDQIWTEQISSKNRNMIRKAEKNGLEFRVKNDYDFVRGFVELYNETMERVQAEPFYFFPESYYKAFIVGLQGAVFVGAVMKGEDLICAALFMYSACYGHYHLSGGTRVSLSSGANNLMLWKAALEMKKLGVREFHLGGGTSSASGDSLYKFKKSFSRNEKSFYIGKMIFNATAYQDICRKWRATYPEKAEKYGSRLLCYRY